MDYFWAAPPVSRTITAITFVQSALLYGGILSSYYLFFLPHRLLRFPPEVWRLASPFFITGPGLSFLLDLYFIYTYASGLETTSPRFGSPADFFVYVVFLCLVILLTAGFGLGNYIFTSALSLAFISTWAQDNRGRKVTFFVVTIPAELLPWAVLTVSLLSAGGGAALRDVTGVLAAHLYDFLTRIYPTFGGGRNYITTPRFIRRWFAGVTPRTAERGAGTAFRPRQPTEQSSSGWSSSLGGSWNGRGTGRRLGGE